MFRLTDILDDIQPCDVSGILELDQQRLKTILVCAELLGVEAFPVELLKVRTLLQKLQDAVDDTEIFHNETSLFIGVSRRNGE